jgi:hypothetical protein
MVKDTRSWGVPDGSEAAVDSRASLLVRMHESTALLHLVEHDFDGCFATLKALVTVIPAAYGVEEVTGSILLPPQIMEFGPVRAGHHGCSIGEACRWTQVARRLCCRSVNFRK